MRKQRILITGATSGLGAGTAIGLAKVGHHVTAAGETWQQVTSFREMADEAKARLTTIKLDLLNPIDLEHAAPLDALLATILEAGTVTLCTQCAARRDLTPADLLRGIRIAGAPAFVEEVMAPGARSLVY